MRIIALLCLAVTAVSAIAETSFCNVYTKAVFGVNVSSPQNQYNLINNVVTRTILGCNSVNPALSASGANCTGLGSNSTTVVVGLLDAASNNLQFFNGTGNFTINTQTGSQGLNTAANIPIGPGGSTVFATVNNSKATPNPSANFLIGHLIEFFGRDLGCDVNATSTSSANGISSYNGMSNMTLLHKDMKINDAVWDGFVTALVGALTSYGVPMTGENSILSVIVPYASQFLRSSRGDNVICNQPDCDCAPNTQGNNCDPIPAATTTTPPTQAPAGNTTTVPPTTAPAGNTTTTPPTTAPTSAPAKNNNTASMVTVSPVVMVALTSVVAMLA